MSFLSKKRNRARNARAKRRVRGINYTIRHFYKPKTTAKLLPDTSFFGSLLEKYAISNITDSDEK